MGCAVLRAVWIGLRQIIAVSLRWFLLTLGVLVPLAVTYVLWDRRRSRWLSYRGDRVLRSHERATGVRNALARWRRDRLIEVVFTGRLCLGVVPLLVFSFHAVLVRTILSTGRFVELPQLQHSQFLPILWQVQASVLGTTFVVVVLLIQAASGRSNVEDLMDVYVRRTPLVPFAIAGLCVSVSIGACVALFRQQSGISETHNHSLALSSFVIFVMFLFVTAWLYCGVLLWIRPSWASRQRRRRLETNTLLLVRHQIHTRLCRHLLETECRQLGLRFVEYSSARRDLGPIRANRFGEIVDVDLATLRRFAESLEHTVSVPRHPDAQVKGFLLVGIGSRLSAGRDVLARVHPDDLSHHHGRLLRSLFRVTRT